MLPTAHGEAEVKDRKGYVEIKTEMKNMEPASRFGPEFLTYVLWGITPQGRPVNLGEILLDDNRRGVLNVTTDLQAFGMIVTAEPYFGVTQPSDVVVLENFARPDTEGIIQPIEAKYELLQRGQYVTNVARTELTPITVDKKTPLDLAQARNAIRIARWAGAEKDTPDSFAKAESLLQQAESYQARDRGSKSVTTTARGAVQAAEDARLVALKRQDEARLAREREEAAQREQQAQVAADQAALDRARAEEQQRVEVQRRAAAEAEAEKSRKEAEAAAARADQERQAAQAATARADQERQAAQAEIERARQAANQAEQDQQELRKRLIEQFNAIVETRDTARGLVVNLSDVLFDVGKWTLKPGAREKLARLAGIVLSHPGLKLEVEGHTDSTGADEFNQILSERRANAVRDFLLEQGVNSVNITAQGFGKGQPIASNDTAAGRQLNRRVEMIVSGEIIGTPIGSTRPTSSLR
jgi:outer membrane protein OmpA-like peptidoglycan-associated protein